MSGRVDDALGVLRAHEFPGYPDEVRDAVDVLAGELAKQQEWIDRVSLVSTEAATAADKAERERDALAAQVAPMSCGHPAACVVQADEGTAYCGWCATWQEAEHPFDKSEYDAMFEERRVAYERADALAVQVDEWKLEAERRGLPKELMQRLHRAEAQVEQLREALEQIKANAVGWHGVEEDNSGHVRALKVIAQWCDEALPPVPRSKPGAPPHERA